MTRDEALKLSDKALAEMVDLYRYRGTRLSYVEAKREEQPVRIYENVQYDRVPSYSTSIAAAWELVVASDEERGWRLCQHDGNLEVEIACQDPEGQATCIREVGAATAPRAISLAFLLALQEREE